MCTVLLTAHCIDRRYSCQGNTKNLNHRRAHYDCVVAAAVLCCAVAHLPFVLLLQLCVWPDELQVVADLGQQRKGGKHQAVGTTQPAQCDTARRQPDHPRQVASWLCATDTEAQVS